MSANLGFSCKGTVVKVGEVNGAEHTIAVGFDGRFLEPKPDLAAVMLANVTAFLTVLDTLEVRADVAE